MNGWLKNFHWQDAALPCFAIVSVLALLFRLPNGLMDFLLSINLALSATIFLSTFFVRKPLEFSSFPTILLTTTLFRLVLNVSTTRLILTKGDAGQVIDAFSRFIAGDNIVVGAVIFLIFIIIQFVVITKGATRISEVSARFTLDAMPGKQSAIDFDLNAGNITEEEAKAARAELSEQADFFGAMDGASKFVRGDAVAGLAIVAINVIGGLCIGMMQRHMSIGDAAELYSKLTIGDGLVSQIPAFLISLATGLLVARSSRSQNVSEVALKQTFGKPIVLASAGVFLVVLSLTGLPVLPLWTLAVGFFALSWALSRKSGDSKENAASAQNVENKNAASNKNKRANDEDDVAQYLNVDPMEIVIGPGLIAVAQPEEGPTLLDRVRVVRQKIASELGLILPKVSIRDSEALDDDRFSIKINGDEVATSIAYPQLTLAVDAGYAAGPLKGLQTTAPGSGASAYWIDESERGRAEEFGYELWTAGDFIEKKTLEVSRREAATLLTRDGTKRLIERLRGVMPTLADEALGAVGETSRETSARLAKIQSVLQLLLREGVSIRRLDVILEALNDLDLREPDADPYRALEYVRTRTARQISAQYRNEDGELRVAMPDPALEDALRAALGKSESCEPCFTLRPDLLNKLTEAFRSACATMRENGVRPVALVDRALRYALHEALRVGVPQFAVLAYEEVDASTKVVQEVAVECEEFDAFNAHEA